MGGSIEQLYCKLSVEEFLSRSWMLNITYYTDTFSLHAKTLKYKPNCKELPHRNEIYIFLRVDCFRSQVFLLGSLLCLDLVQLSCLKLGQWQRELLLVSDPGHDGSKCYDSVSNYNYNNSCSHLMSCKEGSRSDTDRQEAGVA